MTLGDLKNMTPEQRRSLAHMNSTPLSEEARTALSKVLGEERPEPEPGKSAYDEKGIPVDNFKHNKYDPNYDYDCDEDDFDLRGPMNATDDVPWLRRGHPGHHDVDGAKWGPVVSNVDPDWRSTKVGRIFTDAQILKFAEKGDVTNLVRERAFAMNWDHCCNNNWRNYIGVRNDTLRGMVRDDRDLRLVELAMQSAMQWLGTNCGYSFVHECEKIAEHEMARLLPALAANRKRIDEFSSMIDLLTVEAPNGKTAKGSVSEKSEEGASTRPSESEEEVHLPI